MEMPGVSEEGEIRQFLKKLLAGTEPMLEFAVVARGPRDGDLVLSKKEKLKKPAVVKAAEKAPQNQEKGKTVKLYVMVGECRLVAEGGTVLLAIVRGKAPPQAVSCLEHLLVRGPYKALGFTGIQLMEIEEETEGPSPTPGTSEPETPSVVPPPPPPSSPPPRGSSNLAERLKALLLRSKSAIAGAPDLRGTLEPLGREAATAVQSNASDAIARLDQLEAALNRVVVDGVTGDAKKSVVAYAKLLLLWESARKKVHSELHSLEQNILASFEGDPDLPKIQEGARRLDDVLTGFDDRLQNLLDEGLSVEDADRDDLHGRILEVVDEYLAYAEGDALVNAVQTNPFAPVAVQATLVATLNVISKQLQP